MEAWVHTWVRNKFISVTGIVDSIDNTLYYLRTGEYLWVCTDAAEEMVRDARIDGYIVSECLVDYKGEVYGEKVSSITNHAGCLACTDGYYWFIEPQTGAIVKIIERYDSSG